MSGFGVQVSSFELGPDSRLLVTGIMAANLPSGFSLFLAFHESSSSIQRIFTLYSAASMGTASAVFGSHRIGGCFAGRGDSLLAGEISEGGPRRPPASRI